MSQPRIKTSRESEVREESKVFVFIGVRSSQVSDSASFHSRFTQGSLKTDVRYSIYENQSVLHRTSTVNINWQSKTEAQYFS